MRVPGISLFPALCAAAGLLRPEPEYPFWKGRRFRFDFAWPDVKIALEKEGGIWLQKHGKKSRHFYGDGAIKDMEKYNHAAVLGWRILRATPKQFETGEVILLLKQIAELHKPTGIRQ